jgi:hypothetical protein
LDALVQATLKEVAVVKVREMQVARDDAEETARAANVDDNTIALAVKAAEDAAEQKAYLPFFSDVWPKGVKTLLRTQNTNIEVFAEHQARKMLWEEYTRFIDAALVHASVVDNPGHYDHRYFFVSTNSVAHYLSGHVAGAAANNLFLKSKEHFLKEAKKLLRSGGAVNPSVRGFLVEHVMLAAVACRGLPVWMTSEGKKRGRGTDPPLLVQERVIMIPDAVRYFGSPTDYLSSQDHPIVLWVPLQWNYMGIDAVLRIQPLEDLKEAKVREIRNTARSDRRAQLTPFLSRVNELFVCARNHGRNILP